MKGGWTGGQYSVFRVLFGLYLVIHFLRLVPYGTELFSSSGLLPQASLSPLIHLFPNVLGLWDAPVFVTALLLGAAGSSVLLAIGLHDRPAALAIWYVWACLFGRNPLISNPSLPYIGWMLLAHALVPPAPYGSWSARGRPDPAGAWRMPGAIHAAAWIVMATGYSYSGITKLLSPSWMDGTALARVFDNPLARPGPLRDALLALPPGVLGAATWSALALEVGFAPLAVSRSIRPWIWSLMLAMHLALVAVIDFADLSLGMVMLHLFTFEPAWIRPLRAGGAETIFYDGHCGLCHRIVRFVLAEDPAGRAFRFAPLDSDAFRAAVPPPRPASLPDSIVLRTAEGTLLTRSEAILHTLRRLGGAWRVLADVVGLIPRRMRDAVYDGCARVRHRLFRAPVAACPIVPSDLRQRFLV